MKQREVLKFNKQDKQLVLDDMVQEDRVLLYLNDIFINEFVCLNESIKELCYGYLYNQGYINSINQITCYEENKNVVRIKYSKQKDEVEIVKKDSFDLNKVSIIMNDFNNGSVLFEKTGAIHTYGLYDNEKRIIIKEDVGRHNALDKMSGYALINNISTTNKIIVTSGRLTSEMASKLKHHSIKAIISISTPTINAIDLFEQDHVTAIGFARNNRFNVYTNLSCYK